MLSLSQFVEDFCLALRECYLNITTFDSYYKITLLKSSVYWNKFGRWKLILETSLTTNFIAVGPSSESTDDRNFSDLLLSLINLGICHWQQGKVVACTLNIALIQSVNATHGRCSARTEPDRRIKLKLVYLRSEYSTSNTKSGGGQTKHLQSPGLFGPI